MFVEVRNVIGAHSHAQDAGRTEDVVALYTPDAVLERPGADPIEGHAALREAFGAPARPQLHLVGNTVITSSTDDEAVAVSDVVLLERGDSGWAVRLVGRYEDALRRDDDGWRLRRRRFVHIG